MVSIFKFFVYLGIDFQDFVLNMGIPFHKFGINMGIPFQNFGTNMCTHFSSWAARPYPKLGRTQPGNILMKFR